MCTVQHVSFASNHRMFVALRPSDDPSNGGLALCVGSTLAMEDVSSAHGRSVHVMGKAGKHRSRRWRRPRTQRRRGEGLWAYRLLPPGLPASFVGTGSGWVSCGLRTPGEAEERAQLEDLAAQQQIVMVQMEERRAQLRTARSAAEDAVHAVIVPWIGLPLVFVRKSVRMYRMYSLKGGVSHSRSLLNPHLPSDDLFRY